MNAACLGKIARRIVRLAHVWSVPKVLVRRGSITAALNNENRK
jgi:hypothetical protein